jgi:hypothetical protein
MSVEILLMPGIIILSAISHRPTYATNTTEKFVEFLRNCIYFLPPMMQFFICTIKGYKG